MNISTSLICCDLSNIKQDIDTLLDNGFNWLHADFMDGHFVPRYGISPELIQWIRKKYGNNVIIDSHLMVDDPYTYMDVIAPYSDWYFFHYEAVKDPFRVIQTLKKKYPNVKVGVTYNLMTPNECIKSVIDNASIYVDGIMFMGISPGVLGTDSLSHAVCRKLMFMNDNYIDMPTFIDGSVNFNSMKDYKAWNTYTVVCGGSTLLKDVRNDENRVDDMIKNINKIKNIIK